MAEPGRIEPARSATTQGRSALLLAGAATATYRALARRGAARSAPRLTPTQDVWGLLLKDVPRTRAPGRLAWWRGRVDALAARARYGDARVEERWAPRGGPARALFGLFEQARVEALAAQEFPGMRRNLAALFLHQWERARPEGAIRGVGGGWIETVGLLARVPLGAPLPEVAEREVGTRWRAWLPPEVAQGLTEMRALRADPEEFSRRSLAVIAAVLSSLEEERGMPFAGPASPQPEKNDATASPAAEGTAGEKANSAAQDRRADLRRPAEGGIPGGAEKDRSSSAQAGYAVYTRAFDGIFRGSELGDTATMERLRRELDARIADRGTDIRRWAHRLQRYLLVLQARTWQFDCEEGVLDAARLSRVVTRPYEPLAYKQESEARLPDTVVSLLVDNSGSMRGVPIATAAACAEILGRILERCGVKTEILGFTTRTWHGGRARSKWKADGAPRHPGRIADLQHVIYKHADEPWRRARGSLALMLDERHLKENIDGEALEWAVQRLRRRAETRRILIVISDGAPLDEATLEANGVDYLDRHLRSVIGDIERDGSVELLAVGIGQKVTAYYRHAIELDTVGELSGALVTQLIQQLGRPSRRTAGGRSAGFDPPAGRQQRSMQP